MKITDPDFFCIPAPELARKLLGKILCRALDDGKVIRGRITETEAYGGFSQPDTACHAHKGITKRNAPMFERGGTIYVYLCYGIHEMLNITSGTVGDGQAVLIRAIQGIIGPGRVTKTLLINRCLSGKDIMNCNELWIEDDDFVVDNTRIERLARIGISYASETDQARLERYRLNI